MVESLKVNTSVCGNVKHFFLGGGGTRAISTHAFTYTLHADPESRKLRKLDSSRLGRKDSGGSPSYTQAETDGAQRLQTGMGELGDSRLWGVEHM